MFSKHSVFEKNDVLFHKVVVHLRTLSCYVEGYHFTVRGTDIERGEGEGEERSKDES